MYVGRRIRLFLHIGSDINVAYDTVIAVINIEKENKINSEFIENLNKKGDCIVLDSNVSRSAVIFSQDNKTKVYLSPVSAPAIKRRMAIVDRFNFIDKSF